MYYIKQLHNPNKHPLMPDDYPWQVSPVQIAENWEPLVGTLSDLEAQFDLTLYNNANKKIPASVTPRQIQIALILSGVPLQTIDNMINSLPEPQKSIVRVTWEKSTLFERSNPILNQMAPLLNLTSDQLDDLFIVAAGL